MKLLYKELALAAHPTSIVFAVLGCLVIVPAYPYTVIFMFGCLAPYITFQYARETNDQWYTAILPVTKRESVRGKYMLIISIQLFQLLIAVPSVFLRKILEVENNPVGMDATLAWFGFGLMIYGVFDLVFFPAYYKNGYKAGKAFVIAAIPMLLLMVAAEGSVRIPQLTWLDSYAPADLMQQVPILLIGILCYGGFVTLAYIISVKRFEHVDL
ncbi:MAG TPA: ABC-2 transporter permease [Candidatus Limivivens merdigallinarum]|uniref:ABC-2 transporter permease n=1 Tax=Candidatus Limivivens merdigallinarum TaxID=2840859 RepID=A0A9D0ZWU8_9FIRM|nr:ABC-2 transporter permease [Candidatus Limivivens merdigallinarum]